MTRIKRFIMKLKIKFKKWIFKEELNDIKEIKEWYEEALNKINNTTERLYDAEIQHKKSQQLLSDCHKFMNSICDVGTDIGFRSDDHSWAVICIHGKMDYVKFVDMRQKDIQSIVNFLRNFEYSNRVTDSPLNKRWIEDMIFRI